MAASEQTADVLTMPSRTYRLPGDEPPHRAGRFVESDRIIGAYRQIGSLVEPGLHRHDGPRPFGAPQPHETLTECMEQSGLDGDVHPQGDGACSLLTIRKKGMLDSRACEVGASGWQSPIARMSSSVRTARIADHMGARCAILAGRPRS